VNEAGAFSGPTPELSTWVSRDPIGELGGMNLYSYTENNPILYTDPSGLTIRVVDASPQNVTSTYQALSYLSQSPIMSEVISQLESSSNVYTIVPTDHMPPYSNRYDPETRTIYWMPHKALKVDPCKKGQTPALALGHELAHAYNDDNDRDAMLERAMTPTGDAYENEEEKNVIRMFENNAAMDLGESLRFWHQQPSNYGYGSYTVSSSVSR